VINPPDEPDVAVRRTVVDLATGFRIIVAVPADESVTDCAIFPVL